MTKIFVIYHLDGGITLVEQSENQRNFTPMDCVSQMVNHLNSINSDVPECDIIIETHDSHWQKQLAERSIA
ncbi:MAG: hypothetical protein IJT61_03995 [Bacteroidales bacterium]|nr:hypothetical protein [Bacteroidales bacterium]